MSFDCSSREDSYIVTMFLIEEFSSSSFCNFRVIVWHSNSSEVRSSLEIFRGDSGLYVSTGANPFGTFGGGGNRALPGDIVRIVPGIPDGFFGVIGALTVDNPAIGGFSASIS